MGINGWVTLPSKAILYCVSCWEKQPKPRRDVMRAGDDLQASRGRRRWDQRTRSGQSTLGSERRSALKKDLTEPALLEMSGYAALIRLGQEGSLFVDLASAPT